MQNDALAIHIEETAEISVVRIEVVAAGPSDTHQAVDLAVGVFCRNVRSLMDEHWRPEAVCFTHSAPPDLTVHRRLFGVTPYFDQGFNGVVFRRADFDAPIPSADPDMARQIERYVAEIGLRRANSARDKTAEIIAIPLPTGLCNAHRVARHIGVDRRTLHRRLAAEGTTFSELTDEMRKKLAYSLMASHGRALATIAEHLGFSGASAFSHWFRRTHGCSPRAYRREIF